MELPRTNAITLRELLDRGHVDFRNMSFTGSDVRPLIDKIGCDVRFVVEEPDTFFIVVTPQAHGNGPYRIFPGAPVRVAEYAGELSLHDGIPVFGTYFCLHNYGHNPRTGGPLFAGKHGWDDVKAPRLEAIVHNPHVSAAIYHIDKD